MASAVIPQINLKINQSNHQQINQSSTPLTSEEPADKLSYSCKFCKKIYSSPHSLRTHVKWHTGDLKHKCTFCDKKFRNPSELRRHEMTHTGEKPHKCPHCSMKFIQKTSLREHIEKKHPLEKPLPEDPKPPSLETTLTFGSKPSSMETNSAKLSCKFCQKAFTDKQSLQDHEEKEAKEFEALHESFEEAEFKELDNFGLQEYLPYGLPDVKALTGVDFGTFMDQLENPEIPDLGTTLPPLIQKSTLSSGFNNNGQIFHNFVPDLSEVKNTTSTFLQIPVSALAKIEVKSEVDESKPILMNQLQQIKVEQNPEPSPNYPATVQIKTEVKQQFSSPQSFNTLNQVKTELEIKPEPLATNSESDSSENEDAIIQQYFAELEGQFPHLRSKLAPTNPPQTNISSIPNFQTILVQQNILKSETDPIISADSPRYTGASTPVDTIQASSLTQLSPPIYNNASSRSSPTQPKQPSPTVHAPFVPVSNQPIIARPQQPDQINSLLQPNMARPTLNVTSTRSDILPPRSAQTTVLSSPLVETYQSVQLAPQQYYQTVQIDTNHPPVYQIQDTGQIDPYTEGILNQIEGKISNWTELSYTGSFHTSPDSNELFTVTSISSKNPSQIVTAIQQPQVCAGESYQVHTTYIDENGQQYEPVNGQWSQAFQASAGQLSQGGNLQVIQLPNPTEAEIDLPGGVWVSGKPSLPKRWKMRTVESSMGSRMIKKSQFLAPDGQFFESRKSALDHMIRAGAYDNEDIDMMRKGLRNKTCFDWESGGEYVPLGWKTREKISTDNKTRLFFLSPGGISFPSRRAAFDHMIKDGKYSKVDIDTMKSGLRSRRMERKDFIVGDPSVPVGWKIRVNDQMKESFRSPSGVFFHSRQTVLEHLIKENCSQTDIALVQSRLTSGRKKRRKRSAAGDEKWIDNDQTVPGGWKMRVVNCSDGHAVTFFKTPDGTTLKGRKAALDHMLKTGVYSEKDIEIMKSHLNVISRVSDMWELGDPTLPTGWKIKKYKSKTSIGRVHCEYLSPQNHVFRSRKAVVEHMRKVGVYSKEDILKVEAGNTKYKGQKRVMSVGDGWIESEGLPKGWRLKRHLEGEQRIFKYLSPCGKEVWSHEAMLEEISKSGNCSQEDIEKLHRIVGSLPSLPKTATLVSKSPTIPIPTEFKPMILPPQMSVTPTLTQPFQSPLKTNLIALTETPLPKQSPIPQSSIQSFPTPFTTTPTSLSNLQTLQTAATTPTTLSTPITALVGVRGSEPQTSATIQATILTSKLPSCTRVSILPNSQESATRQFSTNVISKSTQLVLEPQLDKSILGSFISKPSSQVQLSSQNIFNSPTSQKPVKITQIATKSTQLIRKPIPSQLNNNLGSKPGPIPYFATKSAPPPTTNQNITKIISESPINPQVLPKNAIKTTDFLNLPKNAIKTMDFPDLSKNAIKTTDFPNLPKHALITTDFPNLQKKEIKTTNFPNLLQELANDQNKNKLLPSLRPYHETIISKLKEERLPKMKNSDVGWKSGNSTLPPGWKIRTHFWWDREKQTFMAPDGRIHGSRKAVLNQMEAEGTYAEEDFEKVRRGLKRKGKRKPTCQKKNEEGMKKKNYEFEEEEERKLNSPNKDEEVEIIECLEEIKSHDGSVKEEISKPSVKKELSMIKDSKAADNEKSEKVEEKMEKPSISRDKNEVGENGRSKVGGEKCKKQTKSDKVRVAGIRKSNEGEKQKIKDVKSIKSVPQNGWAIGGSFVIKEDLNKVEIVEDEVDIEEELDNVVLKEIEEDEIMNDAEEVEILQNEKKMKLMSESNKVNPCFVKIFRLPNSSLKNLCYVNW